MVAASQDNGGIGMIQNRTIAELHTLTGRELGLTKWIPVSQEAIDIFAEVTGDQQWIHVDEERAIEGPYGTTIAHGFLVLSMVTPKMKTVLNINAQRGLNYG